MRVFNPRFPKVFILRECFLLEGNKLIDASEKVSKETITDFVKQAINLL